MHCIVVAELAHQFCIVAQDVGTCLYVILIIVLINPNNFRLSGISVYTMISFRNHFNMV